MTEGTDRLQRDLEEALILAMVLLDAPFAHQQDEAMYQEIIDRLVPHLSFRTIYARELVYALEDYRNDLKDPREPSVSRRMTARHRLKLRVHSVLRRQVGELLQRIEARGIQIRRTPGGDDEADESGGEAVA